MRRCKTFTDHIVRGSVALSCLAIPACDDDASSDGASATGSADGGTTEGMPGTDEGDDDGSGGPPETDGEEPPEIECGDGVYSGSLLINPEDPAGVPVETLDGIAIIEGDLFISSTSYTDLTFLACLKEVHGDIQIFNNYFLESTKGTDGLTKVGRLPALSPTQGNPNFVDEGKGSITISSNPMLTDIDGFGGIVQIGEKDPADANKISPQSLVIRSNDALTTITGFGDLQLIFQSLIIQENPALEDIDGLRGLQGVGGIFSVTRNASLCISSVNAVGGGLAVLGDPEHSTTTLNDEGC